MANSMNIHNVKGLKIARHDENNWTTLTIQHESWGVDDEGDHVKIIDSFEIILHHNASERLKIRLEKTS